MIRPSWTASLNPTRLLRETHFFDSIFLVISVPRIESASFLSLDSSWLDPASLGYGFDSRDLRSRVMFTSIVRVDIGFASVVCA